LQKAGRIKKMIKKHEDKNKKSEDQVSKDQASDKIENLENQLKRAVADYQNLEKRIYSEKSEWIKAANKDLLLRLLPGLDSLILAEKHTQDEGVKVSVKHFLDILEEVGVKKIETENQDFDPNLMEAVGTTNGDENKVIEETRAGYKLFDLVLRPSQVIVGKGLAS
jgi:molecular chaperone GrpE